MEKSTLKSVSSAHRQSSVPLSPCRVTHTHNTHASACWQLTETAHTHFQLQEVSKQESLGNTAVVHQG